MLEVIISFIIIVLIVRVYQFVKKTFIEGFESRLKEIRELSLLKKFPQAYTWKEGDAIKTFVASTKISKWIKADVLSYADYTDKLLPASDFELTNFNGLLDGRHFRSENGTEEYSLVRIVPDGAIVRDGNGIQHFVYANFIYLNSSASRRGLTEYNEKDLDMFDETIKALKELNGREN